MFFFRICSSVRWQPAPIMHPSVTVTLFPTKHFDSKILLSPILHASTVQSTSNTLLAPIVNTGTVSVSCLSKGSLKKSHKVIHYYRTLIINYRWIILACSSIKHFSPIIIGPASAMIVALGCTIVPAPIVISPLSFDSSQTRAPTKIFILKFYKTLADHRYMQIDCSYLCLEDMFLL